MIVALVLLICSAILGVLWYETVTGLMDEPRYVMIGHFDSTVGEAGMDISMGDLVYVRSDGLFMVGVPREVSDRSSIAE